MNDRFTYQTKQTYYQHKPQLDVHRLFYLSLHFMGVTTNPSHFDPEGCGEEAGAKTGEKLLSFSFFSLPFLNHKEHTSHKINLARKELFCISQTTTDHTTCLSFVFSFLHVLFLLVKNFPSGLVVVLLLTMWSGFEEQQQKSHKKFWTNSLKAGEVLTNHIFQADLDLAWTYNLAEAAAYYYRKTMRLVCVKAALVFLSKSRRLT